MLPRPRSVPRILAAGHEFRFRWILSDTTWSWQSIDCTFGFHLRAPASLIALQILSARRIHIKSQHSRVYIVCHTIILGRFPCWVLLSNAEGHSDTSTPESSAASRVSAADIGQRGKTAHRPGVYFDQPDVHEPTCVLCVCSFNLPGL